MPEIILEKTYKAKKEIMITEGVIFIDGIKTDKITPCSFHPIGIVSGEMNYENWKIIIKEK